MASSSSREDRKRRRRVWEGHTDVTSAQEAERRVRGPKDNCSSFFRAATQTQWRGETTMTRRRRYWTIPLFLWLLGLSALECAEGSTGTNRNRILHPHDEYMAETTTTTSSTTPERVKIQVIPPLLQDGKVPVQQAQEEGAPMPSIFYIFATWPPAPHSFAPSPRRPVVQPPPPPPPTNQPILAPSPQPTLQPATEVPITSTVMPTIPMTADPTSSPSVSPSVRVTNDPTTTPTTVPTIAPTLLPTLLSSQAPSTASPTGTAPTTITPTTTSPTNRPTGAPTTTRLPILMLPPTITPTTTIRPTATPTILPTHIPTRTITPFPTVSPTTTRHLMANAQVSVPIAFPVTIDTPDRDQALAIWQDYLTNVLTAAFGSEPGITVQTVQLVANDDTTTTPGNRRFLAAEDLLITGSADFAIDEDTVDWKDFSNRVQALLADATTMENLQQALIDAGNPTVLSPPGTETPPDTRKDESSRTPRTPTNAEIVIGFAILILTLLSLLYWVNLFWKKQQTKKRRNQLEALRQQSLRNATMGTSVTPLPKLPVQLQTLTSEEEDDYHMVSNSPVAVPTAGFVSDGELSPTSGADPQSPVDDPFALELRKAVSLDRRAWEEYRMNREKEGAQTVHEGVEVAASVNTSSVASFPYGDEDVRGASPARMGSPRMGSPYSSLPPIRESTRNRIMERVQSRQHNTQESSPAMDDDLEYSPYGERRQHGGNHQPLSEHRGEIRNNRMQEDHHQQQSQYSFLHPLRPRDIEANIPNIEGSSNSEDTPTSGAVRESLDVTSVDDSKGFESKENEPAAEEAEPEKDWPTSLTETMLREVEYISQFVRRYEQKYNKKSAKKAKPGELYDDSGEVIDYDELASEIASPVNRSALQPVSNSAALEEGRVQAKPIPRVEPSQPSTRAANEDYGRLGIGKFTIGRPVAKRSTEFDNKPSRAVQFRESLNEVSPIHSEEDQSPLRQHETRPGFTQKPGRLSSLRGNDSILDITPVGEFAVDDSVSPRHVSNDSTPPANATTSAFAARRQRRQEALELAAEAAEGPRSRRKKVSPRSKNMEFNNIRSIFEAKETDPIVPPNENWQYTGARPSPGSSVAGDSLWE